MESYHTYVPSGKGQLCENTYVSRRPPGSPLASVVAIPTNLLRSQSADAAGVYALIARRWLTTRAPVALSAADLARWASGRNGAMPGGDPLRLRIIVVLRHLVADGWLVATTARGMTSTYIPTWGRTREGRTLAWDASAIQYGRRGTFAAIPIPMLDACFGSYDDGAQIVDHSFTHPLLDLTDIGSYALAQTATVTPTARLAAFGLVSAAGNASLAPIRVLRSMAADGALHTLDAAGQRVPVDLSVTGRTLFLVQTTDRLRDQFTDRSVPPATYADLAQQDAANRDRTDAANLHDRHDSMFPESNRTCDLPPQIKSPHRDGGEHDSEHDQATDMINQVLRNHASLNAFRRVSSGERVELRMLVAVHGDALLAWQERALRSTAERRDGVHPGYYRQCAADAACATTRRSGARRPSTPEAPPSATADTPAPVRPALDDDQRGAIAALEAALGEQIRRPTRLSSVSATQIRAWLSVAEHPGLRRWRDPLGWLMSEIARGNAPPSAATLDTWAHNAPPDPEYWRRRAAAAGNVARITALPDAAAATSTATGDWRASDPDCADDAQASPPTIADLLAAALPANIAAAAALLDIVTSVSGVTIWPRCPLELALTRDIAGVIRDVLDDAGWPSAVQIIAPALPEDNPLSPADPSPGEPPPALPPVAAAVANLPSILPPDAVSVALWQQLSMPARAAVRVRNWHALARLVGIDAARQIAPPGVLEDRPCVKPDAACGQAHRR